MLSPSLDPPVVGPGECIICQNTDPEDDTTFTNDGMQTHLFHVGTTVLSQLSV